MNDAVYIGTIIFLGMVVFFLILKINDYSERIQLQKGKNKKLRKELAEQYQIVSSFLPKLILRKEDPQ